MAGGSLADDELKGLFNVRVARLALLHTRAFQRERPRDDTLAIDNLDARVDKHVSLDAAHVDAIHIVPEGDVRVILLLVVKGHQIHRRLVRQH